MRKLLILAPLLLVACGGNFEKVGPAIGQAVNIVSAVHGAIAQRCQADVEQSVIRRLILKFTDLGQLVDDVCAAIAPGEAFASSKARPPVVKGVVIKYKPLPK